MYNCFSGHKVPPHRRESELLDFLLAQLPRTSPSSQANDTIPNDVAFTEDAIAGLQEGVNRGSTASPELNVASIWPMILVNGLSALLPEHYPVALVMVIRDESSQHSSHRIIECRLRTAV